jgi:hypothetical protein
MPTQSHGHGVPNRHVCLLPWCEYTEKEAQESKIMNPRPNGRISVSGFEFVY